MILSKNEQNLMVDATILFQQAEGPYQIYKTLMWGQFLRFLQRTNLLFLVKNYNNGCLNSFKMKTNFPYH